MDANNGVIFINNDDKLLNKYGLKLTNTVTFAFNNDADVKGKITGYNSMGQAKIEIFYAHKVFSLSLPLYGEQNAKNFLAAVAISLNVV